jgi:hypothetical protein
MSGCSGLNANGTENSVVEGWHGVRAEGQADVRAADDVQPHDRLADTGVRPQVVVHTLHCWIDRL